MDHTSTGTFSKFVGCLVLGGSGFPFKVGESIDWLVDHGGFTFRSSTHFAHVSLLELAELGIAGPGSVTSGGGFAGGGFGIDGALQGIAIASVLNMLTTRTKIHTFVTVVTNFGELHLHYSGMEPGALRIALSGVFVKLRRLDPTWMASRSALLQSQYDQCLITKEELTSLQLKMNAEPVWISLEEIALQKKTLQAEQYRQSLESSPKGTCPNCDKIIQLHAESCPHCKAAFGVGSAWSVTPFAG